MQKLSDLISVYGGEIPATKEFRYTEAPKESIVTVASVKPITDSINPQQQEVITAYPKQGSWRAKLLYGLKHVGKPITASDLAVHILAFEESSDSKTIYDRTTDYLSRLDKAKRIHSDRTERPYKYSLLIS